MKKLLLSLAIAFGMQADAQIIDTIFTFDTLNIDTITSIDTVIMINKTDSSVLSINVNEIDSITFHNDITISYDYTLDTTISYDTIWYLICGGQSITYNGYSYDLIEIDGQCWFKENLRTTRYKDGTPLDYPGSDIGAWANNTTGAYLWYDNDSSLNASTYGALYNWYAADNPAGLCPTGWHVPSDSDWTVLGNYLETNGYNYNGTITGNNYGKALADSIGWDYDSTTGSVGNTDYPSYRNKSGFSALPAGYRNSNGIFYHKGAWAHFLSSSLSSTGQPITKQLWSSMRDLNTQNSTKNNGLSIRCIKD